VKSDDLKLILILSKAILPKLPKPTRMNRN